MTRLSDVIVPEVFTEYVINKTLELSALVQSGIMVNNEEFDNLASGPSTLINMPFWEDLQGEEETVEEDGYYEPQNINASKDVARKQFYGNMWATNNLSSLLSGADPMAAIGDLTAGYWARIQQARLLATLTGVFKSQDMQDKVLDISSLGGEKQYISANSTVDAMQLMGDAKASLTGVMMHSIVETELVKLKLVERLPDEQGVLVPYFLNKKVIVDDAMPYNTKIKEAAIYLFGKGAIAVGNGSHPNIIKTEVFRDGSSHAGKDYFVNRQIQIMHLRGVKWTEEHVEKEFPTIEELANGENYKRVYEPKQVRVVKHKFKIAA